MNLCTCVKLWWHYSHHYYYYYYYYYDDDDDDDKPNGQVALELWRQTHYKYQG